MSDLATALDRIQAQRSVLAHRDLTFLADAQYVYHCHHFNLFHDQTIDDMLGDEAGNEIRTRSARNAFLPLILRLFERLEARTPAERLLLAASLLPWMGHGALEVAVDKAGGEAHGTHLHYGHAWLEKYGARMRRFHPADAVAAGFAAAVSEAVYGLEPGSVYPREESCVALKQPRCQFRLERGAAAAAPRPIDRYAVSRRVAGTMSGWNDEHISRAADGLRGFVRSVAGDTRGLIQAFGVYVTLHLTDYYNETAYEALHSIEKQRPEAVPAAEALLREAGHVCAFHTFGGILLSPEWEGLAGEVSGRVEEIVSACMSVARGLGFGRWVIKDLERGKRFVLATPGDYESPFYLERYGAAEKPRCYFLQGAAQAAMVLGHEYDWTARPALTAELYQRLFQRGALGWRVEEVACTSQGSAFCEVVVSRS